MPDTSQKCTSGLDWSALGLDRAVLDQDDKFRLDPGEWLKDLKLDARTAYQVACNLYMQENTATWSRFNAMVAANSFIVTATGFTLTSAASSKPMSALNALPVVLPAAGIVLCITWWAMMRRGFAYHDVWRDSAYRLEKIFFPYAEALHKAAELRGENRTSHICVPGVATDLHKAPRGQARRYAMAVIGLFFFLYVLALVHFIWLVWDRPS